MPSKHQVLLVSRSEVAAEQIGDCFSAMHDIEIERRTVINGQVDPLGDIATHPDLLLLRVSPDSPDELEALSKYSAEERPPLIVIGDVNDTQTMRAAMRVGARDFISEPVVRDDLIAAVERMTLELRASRDSKSTEITAFVNAKGGSGASFLSANVAHILAAVSNRRTVLMDLDLQIGNLPEYLDLKPTRGLLEALDVAEDLDGMAIEAYLTKHESGLAVMAALKMGIDLHQDMMLDKFDSVIDLLAKSYERIIVDIPKQIEPFAVHVLEHADNIVLVTQQSVPGLNDTARMFEVLTKELGIRAERMIIVANRYVKNAPIQLADIEQSISGASVISIPNDFGAVGDSVNIGVPIYDQARRSSVTKALLRLEERIDGRETEISNGLMARLRAATR